MATIKSYSDLQQSKKLAEILPIESADMLWANDNDVFVVPYDLATREKILHAFIPCWSLSALLGALPNGIVMNKDSQNGRYHFSSTHAGTYVTADNPVDACVDMILKLNELNLL